MANRNFSRLAAFLREAQAVLFTDIVEVTSPQCRNCSDAGSGVDHDGDDRMVAPPDDVASVNGMHQSTGLPDSDFRCLAFNNL